jgi:hypothetical protein
MIGLPKVGTTNIPFQQSINIGSIPCFQEYFEIAQAFSQRVTAGHNLFDGSARFIVVRRRNGI